MVVWGLAASLVRLQPQVQIQAPALLFELQLESARSLKHHASMAWNHSNHYGTGYTLDVSSDVIWLEYAQL